MEQSCSICCRFKSGKPKTRTHSKLWQNIGYEKTSLHINHHNSIYFNLFHTLWLRPALKNPHFFKVTVIQNAQSYPVIRIAVKYWCPLIKSVKCTLDNSKYTCTISGIRKIGQPYCIKKLKLNWTVSKPTQISNSVSLRDLFTMNFIPDFEKALDLLKGLWSLKYSILFHFKDHHIIGLDGFCE
jgi:hypothetical protein